MIDIPRRKQKVKYSRKIVCKSLAPKGDVSYNLQALCYCSVRDLVLGTRAYICQVCALYDPAKNTRRFSDMYEESKKIAEDKIKEFEITSISLEDEIDLSINEFEEEDVDASIKFEKRKAGKAGSDDTSEDFQTSECPFCGELFDDIRIHVRDCEFAPENVSFDDNIPGKRKKKKKATQKSVTSKKKATEKQACPYCKKEYQRLGRHIKSCPKKPADADDTGNDGN